jgi:hypothetical protein
MTAVLFAKSTVCVQPVACYYCNRDIIELTGRKRMESHYRFADGIRTRRHLERIMTTYISVGIAYAAAIDLDVRYAVFTSILGTIIVGVIVYSTGNGAVTACTKRVISK